jgi:hypothetical protein
MSADRIIYRVERETGSGPFNPRGENEPQFMPDGSPADLALRATHRAGRMPAPNRDPVLVQSWQSHEDRGESVSAYRYGFPNMRQARQWFGAPAVVEWLKANGFGLAVYRAPRESVVWGESQVMFKDAIRKGFRSIDVLTSEGAQ